MLAAAISRYAHRTNRIVPPTAPVTAKSSTEMSRMNEIDVDAGVRPAWLGTCRARTAKVTATSDCPVSFCHAFSPRLRWFLILVRSSSRPTAPRPVMRNSTSTPDQVMGVSVTRCANR